MMREEKEGGEMWAEKVPLPYFLLHTFLAKDLSGETYKLKST